MLLCIFIMFSSSFFSFAIAISISLPASKMHVHLLAGEFIEILELRMGLPNPSESN